MANMREFLLGEELQLKLATDVEGAKTMVNEFINSDPELQRKYGRTYNDILNDPEKYKRWVNRIQTEFSGATAAGKVERRMVDPGAVEVPMGGEAPVDAGTYRGPMPETLQIPQGGKPDPNVTGGATAELGKPVSPLQALKNQEEMFKYLVATSAHKWGVPAEGITEAGNLLTGGIDPNSPPEQVKEQIELHKDAQRKFFDPQVFFPAMGYVLFGNWPSLLTIMAAGGLGSIYQDMVNTGRLPNVLPPFDQPALGGRNIESAMSDNVPPERWQEFVDNAGQAAAMQGIWELFGIVVGGPMGGISKTRPGLMGREAVVQGYDEAIKYAERLGIKFPGAYLSAEGYGRMIWDFSHATITSEPLYNKWVAGLVEEIGEKATKDLFSTFSTGLAKNVGELAGPREIGRIIGDTISGAKVFSDLGENFMWRRLGELDRFGVKVDMSQAVGTLNKHADRVLADLAPDEKEMIEKTLQSIRSRIEGFRTRSDVVGKPVARDYVAEEFPLELTFKEADRLRKTFRRFGRRTDNGSVQSLIGEIADDIDGAMMEAAGRVSPEAQGILKDMRAFTQKKADTLNKEVIREMISKHGGKRELWAGIADSIQEAAKGGTGPDVVKQVSDSIDYMIQNRRAWLAGEYDIPEDMIDQVVDRWKTDYFDDLRHPYQGELGAMTEAEAAREAKKEATEYTRTVKVKKELGFKGTEVDDVIRRIRKDMTYDEFSYLMRASKDNIMDTVRQSTINDIMGMVEDVGEVAASGGGLWRKMINKMRNVKTEKESRQIVRDLVGFDPIRLNAEIFHGPAVQQETYKQLFTAPQLRAIKDVTHHLAVITGGGLKHKSNVMVIKLVQAGVLATVAVKTVPVGDEDQSYEIKDALSAGTVLLAPWVLTKVMLKPAWAKWFVKGFTGGVVTREALTNMTRLSTHLWFEDGVPMFIGGGMNEEKASQMGGALIRGLSAESAVEGIPERK